MHTIDKHFRNLTGAVFKKHGFAQGDVLSHWPQIAGDQLAAIARPERLRWPRGENETGGTLFLAVAPGRTLDVQYAAPLLLERLNQFLGFQAITAIKTVQSAAFHAAQPVRKPAPPNISQADVAARLSPVADADLKAALTRLGAAVLSENPRSPQAQEADGTTPSTSSRK
jgi:hypothetical protein